MKFLHLALIFFILLSLFSYAKSNKLDDQDKQAVQKIVKNLVNKLFLLETTDYNSKKLQKELLAMMPDKVGGESEYEPMNKKKYIHFSIKSGKRDKDSVYRHILEDVTPLCRYIEDDTIDCDVLERIKIIEKTDRILKKSIEYETGTEYKFNLKMNGTSDWYINKMKTWYVVRAPRMSTLEIEKKYREEALKNKSIKLNPSDKDEDHMLPTRATRRPENEVPYKMTDVELAEEEAEKEEQERIFQEYQEQLKMENKTKNFKILVDMNGNIIKK